VLHDAAAAAAQQLQAALADQSLTSMNSNFSTFSVIT
jgi:hypothetical protein